MTHPIWSGLNAGAIDSYEINGPAPTPYIEFDGVDTSQFPWLIGSLGDIMYADVMRTWREPERNGLDVLDELRATTVPSERQLVSVSFENRVFGPKRSRKDFP